jgi:hypothetical protein
MNIFETKKEKAFRKHILKTQQDNDKILYYELIHVLDNCSINGQIGVN